MEVLLEHERAMMDITPIHIMASAHYATPFVFGAMEVLPQIEQTVTLTRSYPRVQVVLVFALMNFGQILM